MRQACLPSVEIVTRPAPDASVIWLHGLGADGHDFEPIVAELGLPDDLAIRFIFPHAPAIPVTINGGYIMPAWYDIRLTDLGIEQDEPGIRQSAKSIALLIEREAMRGISTNRIVLAGFSQGGAMALHVGLRYPERLAGIMALSAYLLMPETISHEAHAANRQTPIFLAHGIDDPVVPFALAEATQARLQELECPISWHSYPMQHTVCAEEVRNISRWLRQRLTP